MKRYWRRVLSAVVMVLLVCDCAPVHAGLLGFGFNNGDEETGLPDSYEICGEYGTQIDEGEGILMRTRQQIL